MIVREEFDIVDTERAGLVFDVQLSVVQGVMLVRLCPFAESTAVVEAGACPINQGLRLRESRDRRCEVAIRGGVLVRSFTSLRTPWIVGAIQERNDRVIRSVVSQRRPHPVPV